VREPRLQARRVHAVLAPAPGGRWLRGNGDERGPCGRSGVHGGGSGGDGGQQRLAQRRRAGRGRGLRRQRFETD